MPDDRLTLLTLVLDQAFVQRSWHGPNLMGSLRGVSAEEAAWRPGPDRHNIWEIALHAAYWKYRVYRLLTEAPPLSFDVKGSDWFERPSSAADAGWRDDVARLQAWHERLRRTVAAFDADALEERPGRSEHAYVDLIAGAAAHDTYHAGQIRLIRRLRAG